MGFDIKGYGFILNEIIFEKLDCESQKMFEQQLTDPKRIPEFANLLGFIEERADTLDALEGTSTSACINKYKQVFEREKRPNNEQRKCYLCSNNHSLFQCDKFKGFDVNQRWEEIKKLKLCSICFGKHYTKECKSKFNCSKCQGRHKALQYIFT